MVLSGSALAAETPSTYPADWWKPVPESERASWGEILPQEAGAGEVILSKRTELSVFSNLWPTPFTLDGVQYASLEALWQMMKYPEGPVSQDPRAAAHDWPHTRDEVCALSMFEAKTAGGQANAILRRLGIAWISYQGARFEYRDGGAGSDEHYQLIRRATEAKLAQNPKVRALLKKTCGLKLRMDHDDPSAARYRAYATAALYMELREPLCRPN
jgi:predicted NAD-dependent protein-ADP-ribosyltransferase YbiA (DUF1768 family)